MPFPSDYLIHHKQTIKKQNPKNIKSREEKDLHLALPPRKRHQIRSERASAFTSASITIEAAMAVPLFFLAAVCLIYLLEIMAIQTAVRSGLHLAGRNLSAEMYTLPVVRPATLEADVVSAIGTERLERSIIVGGSSGLHLEESQVSALTAVAQLVVTYEVDLPIPVFSISGIPYRQEIKIKGWCGYVATGLGNTTEETVYVTETGLVYHKNYHCTYLDLSIQPVAAQNVSDLRNSSGGKYYACERCHPSASAKMVYITGYGDRYHSELSCSGLKRTVYAVPLSEAIGKGACSKCGQ